MPVSRAQIEVWKARDQLDRKLATMTRAQIQKYFDGVYERVRKKTGIELHLRVAQPPPGVVARARRARKRLTSRATGR